VSIKDPKLIALQFNDCINSRDLDGLARLMTEEHTFIDREGKVHRPKHVMVQSWREFFRMFPRYKNTFTRVESKGDLVVMRGFAYWSEKEPHDPAIWTATVANDLVKEWRVYADTEGNRRAFNLL
jgi:predicted SnoaL-like aldol condensation-catalyzing enzyme